MKKEKIVGVKNPAKVPLTASKYYNGISSQLSFIKQLRQMPSSQLLMYVNKQLKQH